MAELLRPVLLSLMLGLLEAVRHAGERPGVRWAMRAPAGCALERPERCWFWGESALAN